MTNARQTRARLHFSQFRCRRIRSSMVMVFPRNPSSYAINLRRGKGLAATAVVYLPCLEELSVPGADLFRTMSPTARATSLPTRHRRLQTAKPAAISVYGRPSAIKPAMSLDLAARLRTNQRALRARVELRDTLLDIV